MDDVEVSVVVPVRDASATLPEQLDALAAQTFTGTWEVLLADNGSRDNPGTLASRWADAIPNLRVLDASARLGSNAARNIGVAQARGRLIAFCDGDDRVSPGWLQALVDAAATGFDLVAGPLETRAINSPQTAWRVSPITDALPTRWGFLAFGFSANLAVRAEVLAEIGGWDETLRYGGEDVDLCWRAQLAGHRLGFAPEAVVHYRYRTGTLALFRQTYGYGRTDPQLYRRYRAHGMRVPLLPALRRWAWMVVHAADLVRGRRERDWYALHAGYCFGRLRGSIAQRVLVL